MSFMSNDERGELRIKAFADTVQFRHRNKVLVTIEGLEIAKSCKQGVICRQLRLTLANDFSEYIGCKVVAQFGSAEISCGVLEK